MKKRCKDLLGKRVVLLRDITTNGGTVFIRGIVMVVTGTWRGRYSLEAVGTRASVRGIRPSNFKIQEEA